MLITLGENYFNGSAVFDMSAFISSKNLSDSRNEGMTAHKVKTEQKPLVLIYSDEADTRFLFKTLLEMWNYQTAEAVNIEDAIRVTAKQRPNLILMDVSFSFIEYMETLQKLRNFESFGEIPFVLLSGHSQIHYRAAALKFGAENFLVKPVNFDTLETSLKKIIRKDTKNNLELGEIL